MPTNGLAGGDLIGALLEQHRFYINRNWQYFGAILLIDSLVLNAYGELQADRNLVLAISSTSVVLVSIFYHLINWTDMRVDRNAERLSALQLGELIESPKGVLEGIIPWMKLGVIVAAVPHFWLGGQLGLWVVAGEAAVFLVFIIASELVVRRARQTPVGGMNVQAA